MTLRRLLALLCLVTAIMLLIPGDPGTIVRFIAAVALVMWIVALELGVVEHVDGEEHR